MFGWQFTKKLVISSVVALTLAISAGMAMAGTAAAQMHYGQPWHSTAADHMHYAPPR